MYKLEIYSMNQIVLKKWFVLKSSAVRELFKHLGDYAIISQGNKVIYYDYFNRRFRKL